MARARFDHAHRSVPSSAIAIVNSRCSKRGATAAARTVHCALCTHARTHARTVHARTVHARTHALCTHARTHALCAHARTHARSVHARTHARSVRAHALACTSARTHVRTRAQKHIHTRTVHARPHARTRTHTHTQQTCARTRLRTRTYGTHARTRTRTALMPSLARTARAVAGSGVCACVQRRERANVPRRGHSASPSQCRAAEPVSHCGGLVGCAALGDRPT